ncbi:MULTISPECIES: hypothetical protein [unclassified Neptuniibacter]|uniref:hypothetical protein n=1 Tax=unclassified Neptuniibacter TaxID=2630693 RepID=UPI000C5B67B2|nr:MULTISPECIES: hypothetical protein [unclassified Neptuniibacter]MAY42451.1 hypothetical protein [Oceanospirillaceae bacterium]|tara:strand:- start:36792 stop:37052 length:261 start_codon:yes stop_codon:yes gene_type:complete
MFGPLLELKQQQHKLLGRFKNCQRCELRFQEKLENCPYCAHLDETGLAELLHKKEKMYRSRRELGIWFFLSSSIIIALLLLFNRLF